MGCGESKIKSISLTSDQDWGLPAPAKVWGVQDGDGKAQDCGVHNSGQGFQTGRVPTPHVGGEGGADSAGLVDTEQCSMGVHQSPVCYHQPVQACGGRQWEGSRESSSS